MVRWSRDTAQASLENSPAEDRQGERSYAETAGMVVLLADGNTVWCCHCGDGAPSDSGRGASYLTVHDLLDRH